MPGHVMSVLYFYIQTALSAEHLVHNWEIQLSLLKLRYEHDKREEIKAYSNISLKELLRRGKGRKKK